MIGENRGERDQAFGFVKNFITFEDFLLHKSHCLPFDDHNVSQTCKATNYSLFRFSAYNR